MRVKTSIRSGGIRWNHNEILLRRHAARKGVKVKTGVKAGKLSLNHNETMVESCS